MAKWVKLTTLDGVTTIWVNLAIAAWIIPEGSGSRIVFDGGHDRHADVRETPEQVLSSPQVGW